MDDLDIEDNQNLEARLRALAELAKSSIDAFEEVSERVITFLLKEVFTVVPEEVRPSACPGVMFSKSS